MQEQELLLKLLGLLDQLVAERGVPQENAEVDKQIIKSPNSTLDNGTKPKSNLNTAEKKRLTETFNLFNKMFFEYQKKQKDDTKEKTKVSGMAAKQAKGSQVPKTGKGGGIGAMLGMALAGLLLIVGGIVAFVQGIMTDGPLKGTLKILSKIGIKGGLKLLTTGVMDFVKIIGKIIMFPFKIIKNVVKFFTDGFGKLSKFLMGTTEKAGAKVAGKVAGEVGEGGLMKMVGKFLGKFAKIFKRIPIIGTIISIAFAWSRFKSGDMVGGTIDVLSGLAGLVDIVLPGVGTALSIGLDVLNAVLDSKADQGAGKPPRNKMDILKEMVAPIGNWIWENRQWIPILGAVDRFVLSWEAFSSGDILGGMENFGYAMLNLMPGGMGDKVAEGISAFMGLFETKPEADGTIKPSKGLISEMVDSISKAMVGLWDWLKNYVTEAVKAYLTGGLWGAAEKVGGDIKDTAKKAYDETSKFVGKAWDSTVAKTKEIGGSVVGWAKGTFDKGVGYVKDMFKSAQDTVTDSLKPDGKEAPKLDALAMLGQSMLAMIGETPASGGGGGSSTSPENTGIGNLLSKGEETKSVSEMMYDLQVQANQYLAMIVNNTSRMTAGGGGGGTSSVVMTPQMGPTSNPKVSVPTNRGGYPSSAYAIG